MKTELKYSKRLIKDTILYIPAKIVPGFINIINVAIFTRIFSPDPYGLFIIVTTTALIISAIFSQWLMQSTLRYRVEYTQQYTHRDFNVYFLITLGMINIMVIILGIIIMMTNPFPAYMPYLAVMVSLVVSQMIFDNIITIYQSDLESAKYSIYIIINAVLKLAFPLIIIYLYSIKDIFALLWGTVIANIILSIPMVLMIRGNRGIPRSQLDPIKTSSPSYLSFIKKFVAYGFPMIGWFLGAQLLGLSDRYLLAIFRTSKEVGIYGTNYNLISSAISFIAMPLLTAAHPLLIKIGTADDQTKEKTEKFIAQFSRYFLILCVPLFFYIVFASRFLVGIFLGPEYREGYYLLPIILFGIFSWYFALFGHKGLELREKTHIMLLYVCICTIIKIVSGILFIPKGGMLACAITTALSFFLYPILVYWGTRRYIRWLIPGATLFRTIIASLCPFIPLIILTRVTRISLSGMIVLSFIFVLLYVTMIRVINEITKNEITSGVSWVRDILRIRTSSRAT